MRRKARYLLAIVVVMVLVVGVYWIGRTYNSQPASAASPGTSSSSTTSSSTSSTTPSFSGFYLDVGASASLGFQPTGIVHHNGRRTNTGYANDLLELENLKGVSLTLRQVGCPGETVQTILSTTKADHCYALPETQMTQAVAFLKANQGEAGLVTVDLGFNDIRTCLTPAVANETCVAAAVAAVQVDMPKILADLKAAAGPNVRFVGLEYNDPYLSHYLDGATGPADATATLLAMNQMNTVLGQVYANAGVVVANVPALFQTENNTRVTMANVGSIPENVEEACALTWDCYAAPFGPDDHPNDAGYALIAQAIAAVVPASW
jgi:lysophospholipase L1-like esterase